MFIRFHSGPDMWMFVVIFIGTTQTLRCSEVLSIYRRDNLKHEWNTNEQRDKSREEILDKSSDEKIDKPNEGLSKLPTTIGSSLAVTPSGLYRRFWLVSDNINTLPKHPSQEPPENEENEKDANLKIKIATLVEQTLHETERKLRSLFRVKEKYKDKAPYKVGFILSLVKKSKDIINELFNIAVKHRDDFKALEQLKIFELIIHTNVDTTNLVRQMVEMHVQYLNSTGTLQHKNRVVLLK